MSKAFIAQVIQDSAELTGAAANRAAGELMDAIVKELKKAGKFTLPSFGTFTVRKTKARKGLNPRTGEARALQGIADAQEGGLKHLGLTIGARSA
jgi:DNA-binding protein HU-beta